MSCNVRDNIFYVTIPNVNHLKSFDCLYINSIFSQNCNMQFQTKDDSNVNEFIKFTINRPSDETIIETKIYF